jgi:hypothetical protein
MIKRETSERDTLWQGRIRSTSPRCRSCHTPADATWKACPGEEQGTRTTAPTVSTPIILRPRVINVDKNAAYPKIIADLKAAGVLPEHVELRQVKYLNNLVEQDHRFIKRLIKPSMGFFSFNFFVLVFATQPMCVSYFMKNL